MSLNLLGDAYILILFLVRGHTHNRLDQANVAPRQEYYRAQCIESGTELSNAFQRSGRRYTSKLFGPIRDYSSALSIMIDDKVKKQFKLHRVHQIKITREGIAYPFSFSYLFPPPLFLLEFGLKFVGILTKRFNEPNWSEWRGRSPTEGACIEPLKLLKSYPDFVPSVIPVPSFSETRLKTLSTTFGGREKLGAYLLSPLPSYCLLFFSPPLSLPTLSS
jgi:hypothetical protein